jgi:hypothetical protein
MFRLISCRFRVRLRPGLMPVSSHFRPVSFFLSIPSHLLFPLGRHDDLILATVLKCTAPPPGPWLPRAAGLVLVLPPVRLYTWYR